MRRRDIQWSAQVLARRRSAQRQRGRRQHHHQARNQSVEPDELEQPPHLPDVLRGDRRDLSARLGGAPLDRLREPRRSGWLLAAGPLRYLVGPRVRLLGDPRLGRTSPGHVDRSPDGLPQRTCTCKSGGTEQAARICARDSVRPDAELPHREPGRPERSTGAEATRRPAHHRTEPHSPPSCEAADPELSASHRGRWRGLHRRQSGRHVRGPRVLGLESELQGSEVRSRDFRHRSSARARRPQPRTLGLRRL